MDDLEIDSITTTTSAIQVLKPSFEHHHDGLSLQCTRPRISWKFNCPDDNVRDWDQCAYDLEILNEESQESQVFHVESSQSVLVPWPHESLRSRDRRRVRVKCYGTSTEGANAVNVGVTEWSEWSRLEIALLQHHDWKARPITLRKLMRLNADGSTAPLCFRKCFRLEPGRAVVSAKLYITSHGVYQAYINGERIGDHCMAPGWQSYSHRLHYQTFDVASNLELNDENVIGIEVGPGWWASALTWTHRRFMYGSKELSVMAQLEVRFDDGTVTNILTNDSWRCCTSAVVSSEIYAGEVFDQAIAAELDGWHTFASFAENNWQPTRCRDSVGVPMSPEAPPVRVTQRILPTKIWKSPGGKTLIDFGQNLVGRLHVRKLRRKKNTHVTFRHAEVLENGELYTKALQGANATDEIICDGTALIDWTPRFTFHGFRYVEVSGWSPTDKTEPLSSKSLFAEVLHCDMPRTGWFTCANDEINRLHENAIWSLRGNMLSMPSAAPQRDERLGWTGDLNLSCQSATYVYDLGGTLRNWLEDLACDQLDGSNDSNWKVGVVPLVVPNCIVKRGKHDDLWPPTPMAVWGDAAIMVPWNMYQITGDNAYLKNQWESMKAWIDDGIPRAPDDLWDPNVWQFGDWLDPSAPANASGRGSTNATFVADAFLMHVTWLAVQIAELVIDKTAAQKYTKSLNKISQAFTYKYLTQSGLIAPDTQTAYALTLAFNIIPANLRSAAAARLASRLKHNDFHPSTGFAGTPYLLHALTQTGYANIAYRTLYTRTCPSFLYPITQGSTTIWERWDSILPSASTTNIEDANTTPAQQVNPASMNSLNHTALGSVLHFLHSTVGGISPLTPGWRTILIRPVMNPELSHAATAFESPYGRIECRWTLDTSTPTTTAQEGVDPIKAKVHILVPPNTRAKVVLPPQQKATLLEERGRDAEEGIWVGSGRYTFSTEFKVGHWPPEAILPPWGRDDY